MIQGLQVDVESAELIKILEERKRHHEEKAQVYETEAATLEASLKKVNEDMKVSKVSSGTPVDQMRASAREHRGKGGLLQVHAGARHQGRYVPSDAGRPLPSGNRHQVLEERVNGRIFWIRPFTEPNDYFSTKE